MITCHVCDCPVCICNDLTKVYQRPGQTKVSHLGNTRVIKTLTKTQLVDTHHVCDCPVCLSNDLAKVRQRPGQTKVSNLGDKTATANRSSGISTVAAAAATGKQCQDRCGQCFHTTLRLLSIAQQQVSRQLAGHVTAHKHQINSSSIHALIHICY